MMEETIIKTFYIISIISMLFGSIFILGYTFIILLQIIFCPILYVLVIFIKIYDKLKENKK